MHQVAFFFELMQQYNEEGRPKEQQQRIRVKLSHEDQLANSRLLVNANGKSPGGPFPFPKFRENA
jgi:hypothetical protein